MFGSFRKLGSAQPITAECLRAELIGQRELLIPLKNDRSQRCGRTESSLEFWRVPDETVTYAGTSNFVICLPLRYRYV